MPCFGVLNQSATIRVDNKVILESPEYSSVLKGVIAETVKVKLNQMSLTARAGSVSISGGGVSITIYENRIVVQPRSMAGDIEEAVKRYIPALNKRKILAALAKAGASVVEKPSTSKAGVMSLLVEV